MDGCRLVSTFKSNACLAILFFLMTGCTLDLRILELPSQLEGESNSIDLNSSKNIFNANDLEVLITVSFPFAVVDINEIQKNITGGILSSISGSGSQYVLHIVPTSDGVVDVVIPAQEIAYVGIPDKMPSAQKQLSVVVDTVKPIATLSSTEIGPTGSTAIPVTIVFSEPVTGLLLSDFLISGGGATITSLTGGGSVYTATITPLLSSEISLSIPAGRVTDIAGNENLDSNEFKIRYGLDIPSPVLSTITTSPTNSSSYTVNIDFGAVAVSGLSDDDFNVTNGMATSLVGSGSSYSLTVTPGSDGVVSISLPAGAVLSDTNIGNSASNILNMTVDRTKPTLSLTGPALTLGNVLTEFEWTIGYTGADAGIDLDVSDVLIGGSATSGCIAVVSGTGNLERKVKVSGCSGNGTVNITVLASTASDLAGNVADASVVSANATVDNLPPTLSVGLGSPSSGGASTVFTWSISYSGYSDILLDSSFVTLSGDATFGCQTSVTGSGSNRLVSVTGCSSMVGTSLSMTINKGSAVDVAGNEAALVNSSNTLAISNYAKVGFTTSSSSTVRGAAVNTQNIEVSLERAYDIPVEVRYNIVSSYTTASESADYAMANSGSLIIPSGVTTGNISYDYNGATATSGSKNIQVALDVPLNVSYKVILDKNIHSRVIVDEAASDTFVDISTGRRHVCGVTKGNKLKCWGSNEQGQLGLGLIDFGRNVPTVVDAGTNYKFVSAGGTHTCAITVNDTLRCWGGNSLGQLGDASSMTRHSPVDIDGGTAYKMVSTGINFTCGVTLTNELKCWGNNSSGQLGKGSAGNVTIPTVIDVGVFYDSVSAGRQTFSEAHACAITMSGILKCWGDNSFGQLGDGTKVNSYAPVVINSGVNYKNISAGYMYTCGVTSDDKLQCWGYNMYGEIGASSGGFFLAPTDIDASIKYAQVGTSSTHLTCGITDTGILKCWGSASDFGIGLPNKISAATPQVIDNGTTYLKVTAGDDFACGLSTEGIVKCWGNNSYGNRGDGFSYVNTTPSLVFDEEIKAENFGYDHSCFIRANGVLQCSGEDDGKLGVGKLFVSAAPITLDNGIKYSKVSSSDYFSCGVTTAGVLKCWGTAPLALAANTSFPNVVDAGQAYKSISLGRYHGCAITDSDELKCFGSNGYGQLGIGPTPVSVSVMTAVDVGSKYKKMALGEAHTCGILLDGVLKCWGSNGYGQLGDGTTTNKNTPTIISAGVSYKDVSTLGHTTCAITSDDYLHCWGWNAFRQVGDGATTNVLSPKLIDGGNTFKAVSLAYAGGCAVTSFGVLKCWGENGFGQLGTGNTYSQNNPVVVDGGVDYKNVILGAHYVCGVTTLNTTKCVGRDTYGQMGRGGILYSPAPIRY